MSFAYTMQFFFAQEFCFKVETNRCSYFLIEKRYWKYQSENTDISLHHDGRENSLNNYIVNSCLFSSYFN